MKLEDDFTPGAFALNAPFLTVDGPGRLLGPTAGEFRIRDWTINAPMVVSGDIRIDGKVKLNGPVAVAAGKALRIMPNGQTGLASLTVANGFVNEGIIELSSEVAGFQSMLTVTSGTLTNAVGGVIRISEGTGGPRLVGANIENRGSFEVGQDLTFTGTFANLGSLVVLSPSTLNVQGSLGNTASGVLGGNGTLNLASATVVHEGTVAPGLSPGILTVNGTLPHGPASRFIAEIGGFTAGTQHDQLALSSTATLAGSIRPVLVNGFFPRKDDNFPVITHPNRTGTFATLDNPLPDRIAWEVRYGGATVRLVVLNTAPTLASIPDTTVNEQAPFALAVSASDQDLPPQALTYSLDLAPEGMTIHPSTGAIAWTPTEAQGPGEFDVTVRVTDNGTPPLTHTTSFHMTVKEANTPPQLVLPGPQGGNEQVERVFVVDGTDADQPANALTYEMVSGPEGATFNPVTREFRWTPTEAQGPGNFTATFKVTDENLDAISDRSLSTQASVSLSVAEVNRAPVLAAVAGQSVDEQTLLTVSTSATDPDLPANGLTYSLDVAPAGMSIDPATGRVSWTPTEAQGPDSHAVTVRVTDNGTPPLAHTTSFTVTVREVNRAPTVDPVAGATLHAGTGFATTLSATDPDLPANGFTYSLVSGPEGTSVSSDGRVAWTAPASSAGTVVPFTVRVSDNGSPVLSAERSFEITVTGPVEILGVNLGAEGLTVRWRAVTGRTYRLLQSAALPATEWTPIPGEVTATGAEASKTVPLDSTAAAAFLRVELVP